MSSPEFYIDISSEEEEYIPFRFNNPQRPTTEQSSDQGQVIKKEVMHSEEGKHTLEKELMSFDEERVVKKKMTSEMGERSIKKEVLSSETGESTIKNEQTSYEGGNDTKEVEMAADENELPGNKEESASDGEEPEFDEEELPNEEVAGADDDRSSGTFSPQSSQDPSDRGIQSEGVMSSDEEPQLPPPNNREIAWVRRSESDTESSDDEYNRPAIIELQASLSQMTLRVRNIASINEFALHSLSRCDSDLSDSSDEGYLTPVRFQELPFEVIFVGAPSGVPRTPPNINPHANIAGRRILKAVRRFPHHRD